MHLPPRWSWLSCFAYKMINCLSGLFVCWSIFLAIQNFQRRNSGNFIRLTAFYIDVVHISHARTHTHRHTSFTSFALALLTSIQNTTYTLLCILHKIREPHTHIVNHIISSNYYYFYFSLSSVWSTAFFSALLSHKPHTRTDTYNGSSSSNNAARKNWISPLWHVSAA